MASCPSPCLNGHVKKFKAKKEAVFLLNSHQVLPKMSALSNISFLDTGNIRDKNIIRQIWVGNYVDLFFFFLIMGIINCWENF